MSEEVLECVYKGTIAQYACWQCKHISCCKDKKNKYKMQGWKYPHKMFIKFLESEYGQLDKQLRDRINWGCNCHFRNDKEAWDVLNEMFDYVLCLYYKDEEVGKNGNYM